MHCPTCNKEVELSEGDPQVSRMRLDGAAVRATVEVTDLCSESFDELRKVKLELQRDLFGIPEVKEHLLHELKVEPIKTERIEETPGYVSVLVRFDVTCACGKMPEPYHGLLPGSAEWKAP